MARILALMSLILLAFAANPALAQEKKSAAEISVEESSDQGFLTRFLEEHLSGAGRTVTIRGFHGALSSRATFERITIADDAGPWLEIDNGAIQWTRSALLLRRIDINELSAETIRLPRLPQPAKGTPTPETHGFSLPILPVSVNIQGIDADRVEIGEAVFGQAAAVAVKGSLALRDGEGDAKLNIVRVDGRDGVFDIDAAYSNATQVLKIDTSLDEAPDGIFVNLVGLNGKPSVAAEIKGEGSLDDFSADINLATDGQPRVSGTVALMAATGPDGAPGRGFRAEIGGDVAALLSEDQQAFFGNDAQLLAEGWRGDDGRLSLPVLTLTTDALKLIGTLETSAKGAPTRADLLLTLGEDAGAQKLPVRLPLKGDPPVLVQGGQLQLAYDAAEGSGWTLTGTLDAFDRDQLQIETVTLDGSGTVQLDGSALAAINGAIGFSADRIRSDNPALALAIGPKMDGKASFGWSRGNVFELSDLTINGDSYGLTGDLRLDGLGSGITLSGRVETRYDDLSDLAGLAGHALEGRAVAEISGHYIVLSRAFDGEANLTMTDLHTGQEQLDRLLRGNTSFDVSARRDENGIELRALTLRGRRLSADAGGTISSTASDVKASVSLASLADADPSLGGSLDAEATLVGPAEARKLTINGQAMDLASGIAMLDGALKGRTDLVVEALGSRDGFTIQKLHLENPQLTLAGEGDLTPGAMDAQLSFDLPDLAAINADWAGSFSASGHLTDNSGNRALTLDGTGRDLRFGREDAGAALTGKTTLALTASQGPEGITITRGVVQNDQIDVSVKGTLSQVATDLAGHARVTTLAPLGLGWSGSLDLDGNFRDAGDGSRRLEVSGSARDIAIGQPQVDGLLRGESSVAVTATERGGTFTIDEASIGNPQARATASGSIGGGATDAKAHLALPSLAPLGPGWHGAVEMDATLTQQGDGPRRFTATGTGTDLSFGQSQVDAALRGATSFTLAGIEQGGVVTLEQAVIDNPRLAAQASGRIGGGHTDISADLRADSLAFLGRGIGGSVSLSGTARQQGSTLAVTASGNARNLSVGNAKADALLRGDTRFDLDATSTSGGIVIRQLTAANPQTRLSASGPLSGGVAVEARLADLGLLVPGLPGPVEARGTVRRNGTAVGLDLNLTAPGGTRATVRGTVAQNASTADLTISGNSNAAIANPFLRTRSVEGPITINLRLNGAPSLAALSGRVSLNDARLSDPKLGLGIEGLTITADLGGGGVTVNGSGRPANGGLVAVNGRIGLEGARAIDLTARLDEAVLSDPNLYRTSASGTVAISGSLTAGPLVSGRIALGRTEIRIPSTGLGGAKDIPDITHLGERPPVRATQARAGLIPYPSEESSAAGLAGPPATPPVHPARLDLVIDAPNQVFIRGRGIDAELGGSIRITGDASNVIPVGFLQLIRGRVDLLGKRFDLSEGLLEMQGSFDPVIRLVATASQDGITTRITIEGEASDPDITFSSDPPMPQEEVLSHLLFGRGLDHMSALQAAQLANAVATLAGKGGVGIVGRLRSSFGLDDLDLATDDEGNVTVRAGKYLTENVYTDVSVSGDGTTKLDINLDVSRNLTARGSIDNAGDSTVGLFYERDY